VPRQEPTVAYLGNVYLVARLSVDNSNMQCFYNTTYTYIYVLRTTIINNKRRLEELSLHHD
jgi:hypothetical protein